MQSLKNISFLPVYNPKNLLSPQRTFSETDSSDVKVLYGTFRHNGSSVASWSTFTLKSAGWSAENRSPN